MRRDDIIKKLLNKRNVLEETTHKYDNYVRLPRKIYFSDMRGNVRKYRQMAAIDFAVDLLNLDFYKINIYDYAIRCFPVQNEESYEIIRMADSIYLNERKKAARYIIENFLPICKKDIINIVELNKDDKN